MTETDIQVKAHCATDQGKKRSNNEDSGLVVQLGQKHLAVVADGMGGHNGGEVASEMAVDVIGSYVASATLTDDRDARARCLKAAILKADCKIGERGVASNQLRGMGTTVVVALIYGKSLMVCHAGDSRIYLLRGDKLFQLTCDHTLFQVMLQYGLVKPEDEATYVHRNVVTRFLGTDEELEVDLAQVELRRNDVVLLCTDGLHGLISSGHIADILIDNPDPEEATQKLIAAALDAGGSDNITAAVMRFEGEGLTPAGPEDMNVSYDNNKLVLPR